MGKRFPGGGLHRNTLSYFGLLVTFLGAFLTLFALIVQWGVKPASPYMGVFSFLIFPSVSGSGLFFVAVGMWREGRRRKRLGIEEALPYPKIDLNNPAQRRQFAYTSIGGLLLLTLLGFANYHAFLFTESNTFCGSLCHTVMEPEFTAYKQSPHSKVHCVECHIGSGTSWWVKSKMSGARQVLAVAFHAYERPIPTPVKSLRPARETCEECHWPQKFYGAVLLQIPYFRYDKQNTNDQISLLVKTGGGSSKLGQASGIHWHMIVENNVIFATPDPKQQKIPWFKVTGMYGEEREYMSMENPLTPNQLASLPKHVMDCMDCHNRPTHIFTPPDRAVDLAMNNGNIPIDMPWIKKTAAEALMTPYPDRKTARERIRDRILNFYAAKYPDLYKSRKADIYDTVRVVTDIYNRSVFPKMKVDWRTYPDNIGHRNWPGCFRCHDGKHKTKDGKVLTTKCITCHTMPQRGPLQKLDATLPVSEETWHPFPLRGKHAELLCSKCHSPGIRPPGDCAACHKHSEGLPMGTLACYACHESSGQVEPLKDCASCHGDLSGLHTLGGHPALACTDCHKPHRWKATKRQLCLSCHEDKKNHNATAFCGECHAFKNSD